MSPLASVALGPSVSTMKRKGCRFDPLGARVAAKRIARRTSWGTGSSRYRRIARVVHKPSSRPTVSAGNGVDASSLMSRHATSERSRHEAEAPELGSAFIFAPDRRLLPTPIEATIPHVSHDELVRERAYLDAVYERVVAMRGHARALAAQVNVPGERL